MTKPTPHVRLKTKTHARLKAAAVRRKWSISTFVDEAINEFINKDGLRQPRNAHN